MTLKENNTHKAVRNTKSGKIDIFIKGMDFKALDPQGKKLFTKEDKENYPHWFKDEYLYSLNFEDDLLALFELLDENNRILVNEFFQTF